MRIDFVHELIAFNKIKNVLLVWDGLYCRERR